MMRGMLNKLSGTVRLSLEKWSKNDESHTKIEQGLDNLNKKVDKVLYRIEDQ